LKILEETSKIDDEIFAPLGYVGEEEVSMKLATDWLKINPDIYTFLVDRSTEKAAGYLNAMPIDDLTYDTIKSGALKNDSLQASSVVPYLGKETVKIYLMSLAVSPIHRRWGEGILQTSYVQLFTGFLDKLIGYAKRDGIRATHFIATVWTDEGRWMCRYFQMTPIGEDKVGHDIFELDIDKLKTVPKEKLPAGLKKLLAAYSSIKS
jgi:hypothetical protein